MIRFACPTCKNVVDCPDEMAGSKLACPSCSQRLQVPGPAPNKTVLGTLLPAGDPAAAPRPARATSAPPFPGGPEVRLVHGRQQVCWPCPSCRREVTMPVGSRGLSVACPGCGRFLQVPETDNLPAPPEPPRPDRPAEPEPELLRRAPRRREPLDDEPEWDPRRIVKDRYARRRRGDDDADDSERAHASRMATAGLVCSLIGLGLLFLLFLLFLAAAGPRPGDESEALGILSLFALVGCFVLSLLGVIFGARGMGEVNTENRGAGIAALVCGILGVVVSGALGTFACFAVLWAITLFSRLGRW